MRDHFIQQLYELSTQDPRILLITGDLGFGVFDKFRKDRGDQFINAGVSEQNMTMIATGMAMEGRIPFTYSIGNFPTLRCLEMIRNDAAYHNANVKIVSIGGGFSYGALGISHHATEDLSIMRSLPDVNVYAPCGLLETVELTKALVDIQGTCYLRLDKSSGNDKVVNENPFEIGRLRLLRNGDISVIVVGGILNEVQTAAEILQKSGIEIRIIACHSIKPFDTEGLIRLTDKSDAVVTVEEHTIHGGLGSVVAESFMDTGYIPKRFKRIALKAGFSSIVGTQEYLRECYGLDGSSIARSIKTLMS